MIDTTDWKYFEFKKIFIMKKGFYNKKPEYVAGGDIPFIGATDKNNGVTGYYTLEEIDNSSKTGDKNNVELKFKMFPKNSVCITNNGSVGYAYYQDKPFTCSHDVNPIYLKDREFNKFTGMFIATVIMQDRYRWGYGRKWRPQRMEHSKIKLPVQKDTNNNYIVDPEKKYSSDGFIPDWEYMENYIKRLNHELPTTNITKNYSLNKNTFKEYIFNDLNIDIYKAKPHAKVDLNFSKKKDDNRFPFVSRTELNNSVDGWVILDDGMILEDGNALVIGDTTSTVSYQHKPFITGDHIVIIRAEWLNKYTAIYIKTLLDMERYRYGYARAYKMESIKNTKLLLPSDNDGKVDWKYIENYIQNLPFSDRI